MDLPLADFKFALCGISVARKRKLATNPVDVDRHSQSFRSRLNRRVRARNARELAGWLADWLGARDALKPRLNSKLADNRRSLFTVRRSVYIPPAAHLHPPSILASRRRVYADVKSINGIAHAFARTHVHTFIYISTHAYICAHTEGIIFGHKKMRKASSTLRRIVLANRFVHTPFNHPRGIISSRRRTVFGKLLSLVNLVISSRINFLNYRFVE